MLSVVANCRYITILTAGPDTADSGTRAADTDQEIVDLKTLRAIRVLRPLKLVSGVPSKSSTIFGVSNRYTKFGVNH